MLNCKNCERNFKRQDYYAAHKCTGVDFVPTFVPIQNPLNILDEENDVLTEDVELSERNNDVLLEMPNEVMQDSQILTTPEKEAKEGEPFTQIEYAIKDNEVIINEKESISTPSCTKQYRQSKQRARKSFEINNVLKKVEESQRHKILSQTLKSSTEVCKNSIIKTNVETIFEGKVCEAVLKYFKKLKLEHKLSFLNKQLQEILDGELFEDEKLFEMVSKKNWTCLLQGYQC